MECLLVDELMMNRIMKMCEKEHMLCERDYVVAGVSGGADSVCLLFVLLELQKKTPFDLHVVHVNHGIREEAGEDADYVKRLCEKYQLPLTIVECKVEEYAKAHHMSTEEAGREVRYQAFHDVLKKYKGDRPGKIAIAHNQNDCAETVLFHLFRGSGLKGLAGIQAVNGEIIRPLIGISREEIEAYLKERDISFCVDRTNLEDAYSRNRIRHHVLPVAQKEVEHAVEHIQEAAKKIEAAYLFLEDMTKEAYDKCVIKKDEEYIIAFEEYEKLHPTLQPYLCKMVLETAAGHAKDISSVHVEKIRELFSLQVGRELSLPYGVRAKRIYEGILLGKDEEKKVEDWEYLLQDEDKLKLECGQLLEILLPNGDNLSMTLLSASADSLKNIPSIPYTKWLDYDTIKGNVVIRNRRSGDYFVLNEKGQRKTLKSYFVDAKIPSRDRDQKVVLAVEDHVLCLIPERLSYACRINEKTKRILEINYIQA